MKERHNERKERHSYKYDCTDAHLQQFHQNSAGDHINFLFSFTRTYFFFTMNYGKTIFVFLISLYLTSLQNLIASPSPSVLKGGLVYSEESSLGPIYLNRDHVNFIRTIDTSALQNSAQAIKDFTTLYHTFCSKVGNHITPFDKQIPSLQDDEQPKTEELVFSPVKYFLKEGLQVCRSMGARLPEIRNRDSYNEIRFTAIKKAIKKFRAGVYYDTGTTTFRYYSDDKPANHDVGKSPFTHMTYGGDWISGKYKAFWESDKTLIGMAAKHMVIYTDPEDAFAIRLSDNNDEWYKDYILCEKPIDTTPITLTKENNILLQLASHACKRDEKALVASTRYILAEIEAITNLNVTVKEYEPKMSDYFPNIETREEEETEKPRKKRNTHIPHDIQDLHLLYDELFQFFATPPHETARPVRSSRNKRVKREQVIKSKDQVDKDISSLNESFNILIKLLSVPNMTSTTPSQKTTWSYSTKAPKKTTQSIGTTTMKPISTTMASVKSNFNSNSFPTEPPITRTVPLYLVELYHLWNIQKTAKVHNYPFDVWLYKKVTLRDAARSRIDRLRRRRNHHNIQMLPEQADPTKHISSVLHNSSDIPHETQMRAEIYATDRLYKQLINKRVEEAIDEYLDDMAIQHTTSNATLVDVFTNVQQHLNERTSTTTAIDEPHRTRRTPIPTIGLTGMSIANTANSFSTGHAPLAWLGEALGFLLGFPTKNSAEFKQIAKNAKSINALNINEHILSQTVNLLSKRLTFLGQYILQSFKATATVTMEQDLKIIIRYMQVIQQLTLTKYANVLMAAQLGKTSPYAMSRQELITYGKQINIEKGIQITDKVEDTKSTVALINNQIQILIQVPIVDEQKLFHFYHVKILPSFFDNKTFNPILDAEYIALSKSGSKYVEITTAEFLKCILQPDICRVTNPVTPVNENSLCVVKTYQSQKLTCPLQETKIPPKPKVLLTGNKAIYAVPRETHLYVKCSEHLDSHTYTDETVTINGTGEVAFKPSCTITLPGGETYNTPAAVHQQEMTHSGLFEILRQEQTPTNVIIHRLQEHFPTIPPVVLNDIDQYQKEEEIWQQAFEPEELMPFVIRFVTISTAILLIFVVCYCCCPTQTKDFCKLLCWLPRRARRQRRQLNTSNTYKPYDTEIAQQNDIILQKLATQMDELAKAQETRPLRQTPTHHSHGASQFTPTHRFSRPTSRQSDVQIDTDIDEIDNPIPPSIGSPKLTGRYKDLLSSSTHNTPMLKRVHFDKPTTIE
jgi:hypothetical protein